MKRTFYVIILLGIPILGGLIMNALGLEPISTFKDLIYQHLSYEVSNVQFSHGLLALTLVGFGIGVPYVIGYGRSNQIPLQIQQLAQHVEELRGELDNRYTGLDSRSNSIDANLLKLLAGSHEGEELTLLKLLQFFQNELQEMEARLKKPSTEQTELLTSRLGDLEKFITATCEPLAAEQTLAAVLTGVEGFPQAYSDLGMKVTASFQETREAIGRAQHAIKVDVASAKDAIQPVHDTCVQVLHKVGDLQAILEELKQLRTAQGDSADAKLDALIDRLQGLGDFGREIRRVERTLETYQTHHERMVGELSTAKETAAALMATALTTSTSIDRKALAQEVANIVLTTLQKGMAEKGAKS